MMANPVFCLQHRPNEMGCNYGWAIAHFIFADFFFHKRILGGGFKDFWFSPRKLGKMNPFWLIFFQMGSVQPPISIVFSLRESFKSSSFSNKFWMWNPWPLWRHRDWGLPGTQGFPLKPLIVERRFQTYCWWKKSCTSWYGKYPIIYRVSYIPGGAGFLPSTVFPHRQFLKFSQLFEGSLNPPKKP